MGALTGIRLFGTIAAGLAFLAMAWAAQDRFHQVKLRHDLELAIKGCTDAARDASMPLDSCPPAIRNRVIAARAAVACETAITTPTLAGQVIIADDRRFAALNSCPSGVKRLIAIADGQADTITSQSRAIADLTTTRDAAVARAEARSAAATTQRNRAHDAIRQAPAIDAGRRRCDAECLRNLG